MVREILEFRIHILSGTKAEVLEEFEKFKLKNKVYFPSLQVTSVKEGDITKHYYHLLVQYEPKSL